MTLRVRLRRAVLKLLGYYIEPTASERRMVVVGRAGVIRVWK